MTIPHPSPRSPYSWAVAILAEPTRAGRALLLESCPEEWRAMVRETVETQFAKVQAYRQHSTICHKGTAPVPAPRREDTSFRISDFAEAKEAPEVGNAYLSQIRGQLGHPRKDPHV